MAQLIKHPESILHRPGQAMTLTHSDQDFLLSETPMQIFSGELHYFRIPRPYWEDRLAKARAMGLNTICTYMPWNLHEPKPGQFDFHGDGGMLDVAEFVRLAGEMGMWVILRPGPYICAEWDFGGLPGWLLADKNARIRCSDDHYLGAVQCYIKRVGEELAHLTCGAGGPIFMVQVENEYGSYANDADYLRWMRDHLAQAGFDNGTLFFTSDGPQDDMLAAGTLEDVLVTANFGSKAELNLTKLKNFRHDQPIMCGEFWCGWFDQWGKARQGNDDPTTCNTDVKWMVENNASFSIYMFHGGTNFGFTAGANHYDAYAPTVTGYDYWALLDEAGRPTRKYDAVRRILTAKRADEIIPPVPTSPMPMVNIAQEKIRFTESAALLENLPPAIPSAMPQHMEAVGQYMGGAILYRTSIAGLGAGKLNIVEPHDIADVYLDGKLIASLDRSKKEFSVDLPAGKSLEILVWSLGHTNYGPKMLDHKGISDRVEFKHLSLTGWQIFPMPMTSDCLRSLRYSSTDVKGPAFHRGEFELSKSEIGDTYFDTRQFGLGAVWVNGHNLGRYWSVGPQQTLYCPGCWLKEGKNEIVIFDLHSAGRKSIAGLNEPILNEVREQIASK